MLLRRYSSFLHISLVLTWNMILFEAKYHFKKAIFIGTIFLWNVFLFWVIWFTYSSDKMSTLDTIVKDYDKNIVLRVCQRQTFEYLHQKLSHDRSLHDHVFCSCNNVAPVTNLCLGRATTRSHSSQWSKKKVAVET